jgi:hypothetical protein
MRLEELSSLQQLVLPDRWQAEAIQALRAGKDVIVDAPTGAGKTYVFERWAEQTNFSRRALFTVPTRALANDKFAEWRSRGMAGGDHDGGCHRRPRRATDRGDPWRRCRTGWATITARGRPSRSWWWTSTNGWRIPTAGRTTKAFCSRSRRDFNCSCCRARWAIPRMLRSGCGGRAGRWR